MLVLTRKIGEGITVDGHLITVVAISGGRVRLGVKAPVEVKVLRSELKDRSEERKDAAA